MLGAALKLLALYFINNRLSVAKSGLHVFKEDIADYTESRAEIIRDNFQGDVRRIVNSFVGFLVIVVSFIFVGLLASIWIFAVAWNSPNREVILGVSMFVPLIIGLFTFSSVRRSWKNKPLMSEATQVISSDWRSFRYGLDGTADTSDEANQ